jgi:CheY-like chemotaxis protein
MNLVTNASEAIGERDGSIVIRTARDAAIGGVTIEISDSGCGIKPEDRAKIFDPFFTTKSGGHGLGLAVVQRIVQGLGGTIASESECGRGTTFHIVLPSTGEVPARSRPAPALETVEAGDQRASVLIVEDEAVLRLAVAKLLHKAGFPVVEAADGTAAITAIREHKDTICVVLLDITLPGIPSREVLAEIRRVRPKTKVIVTSAYGADRVEQSFPGMEIDFFVRKPYQFADLISQVRQFSREHKKYDSGRP